MREGLSGAPVPGSVPFCQEFSDLSILHGFWPLVAASIGIRETLGWLDMQTAATIVSSDGGHGIMQLTSSYPENWTDPIANIDYALANFLVPIFDELIRRGLSGNALLRVGAASYNAGLETAWAAHLRGDVDAVTTNRYGEGVANIYARLLSEVAP